MINVDLNIIYVCSIFNILMLFLLSVNIPYIFFRRIEHFNSLGGGFISRQVGKALQFKGFKVCKI